MGLSRQSGARLADARLRNGSSQAMAAFMLLAAPSALSAQHNRISPQSNDSDGPARVNLIDQVREIVAQEERLEPRDCNTYDEGNVISGEIVVCARRNRDDTAAAGFDKQAWVNDYAERTAYRDDPEAPDFIIDCFEQGMPFGCFPIGQAPPSVVIVDVEALPAAPPGSDADRIARGLPPSGHD